MFTSDAGFLPANEAVRRMGKVVWVYGFASAQAKSSPYLYVPDQFVDLGEHLLQAISNAAPKLKPHFPGWKVHGE